MMETFDEIVWPSPSECLPVDCPFDVLPVDIVHEVLDALAGRELTIARPSQRRA
jgi:hypothetical protein